MAIIYSPIYANEGRFLHGYPRLRVKLIDICFEASDLKPPRKDQLQSARRTQMEQAEIHTEHASRIDA